MNSWNSLPGQEDSNVSYLIPWNTDDASREQELQSFVSINREHLQKLNALTEEMESQPDLPTSARTLREGKCKKIQNFYMRKKQGWLKVCEEENVEYKQLQAEEVTILADIQQVQAKIDAQKLEMEECRKAEEDLKALYDFKKKALTTAVKTFSRAFGMKLKIGDVDGGEGTFVGTVFFSPKHQSYPAKFTVEPATSRIIDFDASSFIGKEEENALRSRMLDTGNFAELGCNLRSALTHKLAIS